MTNNYEINSQFCICHDSNYLGHAWAIVSYNKIAECNNLSLLYIPAPGTKVFFSSSYCSWYFYCVVKMTDFVIFARKWKCHFTCMQIYLDINLFWIRIHNRNSSYLHVTTLTHWGRATHIYVGKLTIIGSDNGLSPGRRQAIIWTNAGILLIGPLGTNSSQNFNRSSNIFIQENALENVVCEMASILSRPQCVNWKTSPHIVYIDTNSSLGA